MSLISFIKRLFSNIGKMFKGLLPELKEAIHWGVVITDNLNNYVNNPAVDILTAIIPSEVDDNIKVKLREWLPKLLIQLKLADKCANLTDKDAIVKCAVETLQSIDGDVKSAFLHNLSILIAKVAADGKLDWSDGVLILEWYYQNKYNK